MVKAETTCFGHHVHCWVPRERRTQGLRHGHPGSTAAIPGSLLGAANGVSDLASEWITTSEESALIREMIAALLAGNALTVHAVVDEQPH